MSFSAATTHALLIEIAGELDEIESMNEFDFDADRMTAAALRCRLILSTIAERLACGELIEETR